MMNKPARSQNQLCADCQNLIGGSRHTPPHDRLTPISSRRVSAMTGAADEDRYVCKACGHAWLHETGTNSYGWIV